MTGKRVFISTVPFGVNSSAIRLLEEAQIDYEINPLGRKLTETELQEFLVDYDALVAGTEVISKKVIESSKRLKIISRVGIGLDAVDLVAARENGIAVSYTPDAPAPAAAELTVALMLDLLRNVSDANKSLKLEKRWHRSFGRRLGRCVVGIIGCGRIGQKVIQHLKGFEGVKILVNDLERDKVPVLPNVDYSSVDKIITECDVITLHVPLNKGTKDLITSNHFAQMKPDVCLVNVARGGIVNEEHLYQFLSENEKASAAIDVFECEPYTGNLLALNNVVVTPHLGSMTFDCRGRMEVGQLGNFVPQAGLLMDG